MTKSQRSSIALPSCRLEWRPSRWVIATLALLVVLGILSIFVSEMLRPLAWPLVLVTLAYGIRLIRRESSKSTLCFAWHGNDAAVTLDGEPIHDVELQWRGPLAFVRWRDGTGRPKRASWWPDTLPAASRRELRLAAPVTIASRQRGAMAP